MTPQEVQLWSAVYAAVLQGLASNPDARLAWPEIRGRAATEAAFAVRELQERQRA